MNAAADVPPGWRARAMRALDLRPGEGALVLWAGLYIFSLMSSYYVLRPIRDTMGVEGGVEHLQWLFTGTLVAMLAINPLYAALVRRLPIRRFIPLVYLFFVANLAVFAVLMLGAEPGALVWTGRAFFIWVSVFNLFVVSVFWALMVDIFDSEQGKRLFGKLAAAATVGAIAGSGVIATASRAVDTGWLLAGAAALLVFAIYCVTRILHRAHRLLPSARDPERQAAIGGGILSGITHTLRSPYLFNIGLYILFFTVTSTFLYFQQATIARDVFPDRESRTQFFGLVDLAVNVLALAVQLFLTSRILRRLGVALAAAALPAITLAGYAVFAAMPVLAVLVVFQVVRRVTNFGLARPTRELFFTVLAREDKYKAKSVIDTVVYRFGDQLGSWSYALLGPAGMGLGMAGISLVALPLAGAWLVNGLWLGRRQQALAAAVTPPAGAEVAHRERFVRQ